MSKRYNWRNFHSGKPKPSLFRTGYVFIFAFALFIAISKSFYYRKYIAKDEDYASNKYIIQIVTLFLLIYIPGVLLVSWYYRQKNNN